MQPPMQPIPRSRANPRLSNLVLEGGNSACACRVHHPDGRLAALPMLLIGSIYLGLSLLAIGVPLLLFVLVLRLMGLL